MMQALILVQWVHSIGACVLLGTGAGIAFFMLMAHRTGKASIIAHTASVVVIADMIFTASAVVVQPITGVLLALMAGWSLWEGWIVVSIGLYLLTGSLWLPVVWMQIKMRDLAREAVSKDGVLPAQYHRLFRIWYFFGIPAFVSVLSIIWLMLARPSVSLAFFG